MTIWPKYIKQNTQFKVSVYYYSFILFHFNYFKVNVYKKSICVKFKSILDKTHNTKHFSTGYRCLNINNISHFTLNRTISTFSRSQHQSLPAKSNFIWKVTWSHKYSNHKRTIVDCAANFCSLGNPLQFYYPGINTNTEKEIQTHHHHGPPHWLL